MNKLLCTAALAGLVFAATPALAAETGFNTTVGGYMKAYLGWADLDETSALNVDQREFDMVRDTEVHVNAEYVLENGLTFGVQIEATADDGDSFGIDESYAYVSGAWGRVNVGTEDGAAYLLQVAAPSADANIDGIRQFVNPFNYSVTNLNSANVAASALQNGLTSVSGLYSTDGLDYDNDLTTNSDKITYLTPIFYGFQVGASYTPDTSNFADTSNQMGGFNVDGQNDQFGNAWEIAGRWEGVFHNVGINLGTGFTEVDMEEDTVANIINHEDFREWNIGLDLNFGAFGIGAVWTENNGGVKDNGDVETWVVGVDYTTGPYTLGASYLNKEVELTAVNSVESDRYAAGVTYSYAPGITFNGSVQYVEHDTSGPGFVGANSGDVDGTAVLVGSTFRF